MGNRIVRSAWNVALLGLVALMAGGCESSRSVNPFADNAEGVKRGQAIFIGTCGGYCHGTTPGPRDAPFLFDCVWKNGDSDEAIFDVIADGVPKTRMVGFRGAFPEGDDDIWRLVAFIRAAGPQC